MFRCSAQPYAALMPTQKPLLELRLPASSDDPPVARGPRNADTLPRAAPSAAPNRQHRVNFLEPSLRIAVAVGTTIAGDLPASFFLDGSQGFLLVTQTYLIRQATTVPGASRVASAARTASFKRASRQCLIS